MKCLNCKSGYRVDLFGDERYCGFCGAGLQEIRASLEPLDGPFYLDSNEPVEIRIRVHNTGIVPAGISGLEME